LAQQGTIGQAKEVELGGVQRASNQLVVFGNMNRVQVIEKRPREIGATLPELAVVAN
jgi:hypothetical protein